MLAMKSCRLTYPECLPNAGLVLGQLLGCRKGHLRIKRVGIVSKKMCINFFLYDNSKQHPEVLSAYVLRVVFNE